MAQKHLWRVKQVARRAEASRLDLKVAVLEAHESGESLRDIARFAGVSHMTISEIVKGAREVQLEKHD